MEECLPRKRHSVRAVWVPLRMNLNKHTNRSVLGNLIIITVRSRALESLRSRSITYMSLHVRPSPSVENELPGWLSGPSIKQPPVTLNMQSRVSTVPKLRLFPSTPPLGFRVMRGLLSKAEAWLRNVSTLRHTEILSSWRLSSIVTRTWWVLLLVGLLIGKAVTQAVARAPAPRFYTRAAIPNLSGRVPGTQA